MLLLLLGIGIGIVLGAIVFLFIVTHILSDLFKY